MVGIQRRISQGLKVLQYYTTKNWTFKNEKFLRMKERMSPKDRELFFFSVEEVCKFHNDISSASIGLHHIYSSFALFWFHFRLIGMIILETTFSELVIFCSKKSPKHCRKHAFYYIVSIYWINWFRFCFMDWFYGWSVRIGAA